MRIHPLSLDTSYMSTSTNVVTFLALQLLFLYSHFIVPATSQLPLISYASIQGEWHMLRKSIGVSAMHMQLLHNNKVVIYDRTDFGQSNVSLPGGRCRVDDNDTKLKIDCTAHSVLYDVVSNDIRPLMVQTDTWCSSGAVIPDGTLVQTGGFNDGDHVVRVFEPCDDGSCDWFEFPNALMNRRWYASNQILPDGQIIIVGGRGQFNYEFYNPRSSSAFQLSFLRQTMDAWENNLYPFLHLLPDGNLYIFSNTRSILFDYKLNRVIREYPPIPGNDSRNYPSSGSSVLLPIDENLGTNQAEVMVCGGSPPSAYNDARVGIFNPASFTCGRLMVTDEHPAWEMELMPMPRVMGDMLILPNGQVIIVNGAGLGCAGWESAQSPVTRPLIYNPHGARASRFAIMESAERPRLYHSTAILLTDGRVLVGGSNPHVYYSFSTDQPFPTDLSLEAFSPPFLASVYDQVRPDIVQIDKVIYYQKRFSLSFTVANFLPMANLSVRIVTPSFSTHSYSMNQRMVVLKGVEVSVVAPFTYNVSAVGPHSPEIAPQGYYMVFLVHSEIPSSAVWVSVSN